MKISQLASTSLAKKWWLPLAFVAVFVLVRLPGLHLPYHQDEWKNVSASATVEGAGQFFAHPPLMQVIFVSAHSLLGQDYFRVLPLLFSVGSVLLLYAVAKRRFGKSAALWSAFLFAISFYNVLGSLSPDVDGAIIPFFFLLAVYCYDRKWLPALVFVCLAGFLIKLNFVLVVGTLVVDYAWNNRKNLNLKKAGLALAGLGGFGLLYILLLYLIQAIYPAFSISFMLSHARQFTGDEGRNFTQIIIQGLKAVFYLSPLLLVPLSFGSKEIFKKTRIFGLYLVFSFLFYFIVFDFSRGALDKYAMFAIVPLAIICGAIVSEVLSGLKSLHWPSREATRVRSGFLIGALASVILVSLNFLPQAVVALYPKTEWFARVIHGHWNVLTPFNGGSGPAGFYVSFLFIAAAFIVSAIVAAIGYFRKDWRAASMIVLVIIGISYNAVFAEELFLGKINGSLPQVLGETTAWIRKFDGIKAVMTYNDIGAGVLEGMGKYGGRIYATPDAEEAYKKKFAEFVGVYMIIDIPRLYPAGFYYKFFDRCRVLFTTSDGYIDGRVYECSNAKAIIDSL